MRLELDKQFTELSGKPYTDTGSNMSLVLADALSKDNKGNAEKLYAWAIKLNNKEALEIDDVDFKDLINWIKITPRLNNLCKAQLLLELKK